MSSSSRPPRSRYRFGFKGKRPGRGHRAATTDEILDSLTRRAKLMEEEGKTRTLGLQTILEVESDEERLQPSNPKAARAFKPLKTGNLGKYAFGVMLIGGLTFLWIYSRLSESLNLQSLTTLQQTLSRVGFADWQKIALIAFFALSMALFARHSGGRVPRRLFTGV